MHHSTSRPVEAPSAANILNSQHSNTVILTKRMHRHFIRLAQLTNDNDPVLLHLKWGVVVFIRQLIHGTYQQRTLCQMCGYQINKTRWLGPMARFISTESDTQLLESMKLLRLGSRLTSRCFPAASYGRERNHCQNASGYQEAPQARFLPCTHASSAYPGNSGPGSDRDSPRPISIHGTAGRRSAQEPLIVSGCPP